MGCGLVSRNKKIKRSAPLRKIGYIIRVGAQSMLTDIMHEFITVDEHFVIKNTGRLVPLAELPAEHTIQVHDDVILFIWNTLKLIKCRNYKNENEMFGLSYDGRSYIHFEQLALFSKIILNWLSFVDLINEKFIINNQNDEYDKLVMRNDLEKLLRLAEKALQEKRWILHIGV
jgi:adenylate kinase